MSYNFSKGSQVIGDLKAADDTQRDTQIDFGEDEIAFDTSGSTRMHIANDIITTTVPIHISGSVTEGLRIGKAGNDYREIQFETDGVDTAFIQVDASEGMVIGCQSVNDEIIFQTTDAGGISEVMRATANGRLGIGITSPDTALHVDGDIKATGKINAKQRFINTAKYTESSSDQKYVRWDAAGSNGTPGVNNKFLAPCDGELLSVTIRATAAANGTNIAFHKASNGTEDLNTTAVETVGVDMSAANTAYQATFSSSTFSAGEILGISLNPTNGFGNVNITCVWLFDWNS